MGVTLAELAQLVQGQVRGDPGFVVERANSLDRAGANEISFVVDARHVKGAAETRAGALVVTADLAHQFSVNVVVTANPALAFARICARLHPAQSTAPGIHSAAVVHSTARVAASAVVGASASIETDAVIGEQVYIGPGCVIGRGAIIGDGSRLIANVTVLDSCVVGRNCLLHPGAVIGADGFGFARDGSRWVKQPQLGRVVIGDDAEIGANSTVDRGTFGDTVIGNGVKLDNLVHIAHNVRIGDDTAIAAMVGIAGSTVIGKRCTIAGQAGIIDHAEIADDVHITATSLVAESITQAGVYSSSLKAEPAAQWRRNAVRFGQLDELARRLYRLEKQLKATSKE